uniref:vWA domain-containing protein n=1 Tax=Thaumasiovibrio occultus TaxID=1891184 RepID=UPI000B34C13C|nr:VWA domain-containing protein [Thaumasiovibrio occultus]
MTLMQQPRLNQPKITLLAALIVGVIAGCSDRDAARQHTHTEKPLVVAEQPAVEADITSHEQVKRHPIAENSVMLSTPPVESMLLTGAVVTLDAPVADNYQDNPSNGVQQAAQVPLSTFSVDVDTGSYANVRQYLSMGEQPPADAIREEAFVNYFPYDYPLPTTPSQPFAVHTEIAPAPWHEDRQLLRIGLQGYDLTLEERQPSNLVFLVDVSGSMSDPNRLPLLVQSLQMLAKNLNENDSVSIVTYAGSSQVVLPATKGDQTETILAALQQLTSGGSTNGQGGIKMAYQQAKTHFIDGGTNRVLLATDGDFNVGMTDIDALKALIADERDNGISLTTIGFGRGGYNDHLMEQLADVGDGNHAYIDSLHEAQKVLVRQMSGTLQTIARDVKIQVEFNPNTVKEYRLIGYQNRLLNDEDFNNDAVDAGEIGAGHSVTALYEITLVGDQGQIDERRYQNEDASSDDAKQGSTFNNELAQVKVRYKLPEDDNSELLTTIVARDALLTSFNKASESFQFAAASAAFAQKLKDNSYVETLDYAQIAEIANNNRGDDPFNYRGEFVKLVQLAESLH